MGQQRSVVPSRPAILLVITSVTMKFLRALVWMALQEVLEAEMAEALGAEKGERTADRRGYRSGY